MAAPTLEEITEMQYLRVEIECVDVRLTFANKRNDFNQLTILEYQRLQSVLGQIQFKLNFGLERQNLVEIYANQLDDKMMLLWELIHHNDLKGKANYYMNMVAENIKMDTDALLAKNNEIHDRLTQDFENTPDARAEKKALKEIGELEQKLNGLDTSIETEQEDFNRFKDKVEEWCKKIYEEEADLNAQLSAAEQEERKLLGEPEIPKHDSDEAATAASPNAQTEVAPNPEPTAVDADTDDETLMLIENIQENEHFALLLTIKRDSTDSEPSEHSHKTPNDMATSSSADMERDDQSVEPEAGENTSKTSPSMSDQRWPNSNESSQPGSSDRKDESERRRSDRSVRFADNPSTDSSHEQNAAKPRIDSEKTKRHLQFDNAENVVAHSVHDRRASEHNYARSNERSSSTESKAQQPIKRKEMLNENVPSAKKPHYDSQQRTRGHSNEKSPQSGNSTPSHDEPKSTAAHERSMENSPQSPSSSTQRRSTDRQACAESKSVDLFDAVKSGFAPMVIPKTLPDRPAAMSPHSEESVTSSHSSERNAHNQPNPTAARDSEPKAFKTPRNPSTERSTGTESNSKARRSGDHKSYSTEPKASEPIGIPQAAVRSATPMPELLERRTKIKNEPFAPADDDHSEFGELGSFNSIISDPASGKGISSKLSGGKDGHKKSDEDLAMDLDEFDDFEFNVDDSNANANVGADYDSNVGADLDASFGFPFGEEGGEAEEAEWEGAGSFSFKS